jgi:hypothetical protein
VIGLDKAPETVDLSSLNLGEDSRALLGGRAPLEPETNPTARDFVLFALRDADGQSVVDVAVVVNGGAEPVTSMPCYPGILDPAWLSDTEISVCGWVVSLDGDDLECGNGGGGVGAAPVTPEIGLVSAGRAFSYDLDRDGLLDRFESTSGEILKQSECRPSEDVGFRNQE